MPPVRIAVQLQPQLGDYPTLRRRVSEAEDMGIDIVYNWDHFYPLYGGSPDPNAGRHFECWTTLAAWGEQTERIEIGPLVTCNTYRNPNLLADMVRTVDHISGGRVILGIGSGWFEKDYDEYGYEFDTAVGRLKDLEKALPVIEERFEKLDPAPTRKIPILIGGGGKKITLRLTAKHADIWHHFGTPDEQAEKIAVLEKWCGEIGRDPNEIEKAVGVNAGTDPGENGQAYLDVGITQFTIGLSGPDWDLSPVGDWLAWRDEKNA